VRGHYVSLTDEDEIPALVRELGARTVIADIEPVVASWDSGQEELDQGIGRFLDRVGGIEGVAVVCFATNSARMPSALPNRPGIRVEYVASARKPLRAAPYRSMPQPGAVIGDQVATDGMLAARIGYTFLHYRPSLRDMPPGPRILFGGGEILRPVIFHDRQ